MKIKFYSAALTLLAAGLAIIFCLHVLHSENDDISASELASWETEQSEIENILIIGIDKFEQTIIPNGYLNDQQSDFLTLLSLHAGQNSCSVLPINRDTMAEITRLGVFGDEVESFTGQLALAHTFGSGGSDSALNTVKAVSKLLNDLSINHYIVFTMDVVPVINDILGGITVTIRDDFPEEYPRLKPGSTVTLRGDEALAFVRGRRAVGDQTNTNRMTRQKEFIEQIFKQLKEKAEMDPHYLETIFSAVAGSIQSDLSVSQIQNFLERLSEISNIAFLEIEGKLEKGSEYMEFYSNPSSIDRCVQKIVMP